MTICREPLRFQPGLFAPLGEAAGDAAGAAFCAATPTQERRAQGITFTPEWLVECMLDRMPASPGFDTVVDAGAGTGRFALAAALRFPRARVIAVETHPELAGLLSERVRAAGLSGRVQVVEQDFRSAELTLQGRVLFVGNPPYVRHHDMTPHWKAWYRDGMAARGIVASQLAGLHAHFMLRAYQLMKPGDALCWVTAAEWMDNSYGDALRSLCADSPIVPLRALWLAAADEPVFPDALVSAVVVEAGGDENELVDCGVIAGQGMQPARRLDRMALRAAGRWSPLCQPGPLSVAHGVQLGELFRVTRGQVTGLNEAWVLPPGCAGWAEDLAVPAVTRAREIIDGTVIAPDARSRCWRVLDLPRDLDELSARQRVLAEDAILHARALGAHRSYVARQRKPWFAVGMRAPPAAFVSYMGRRPPVFRPNPRGLSFLNIAHGLYPHEPISASRLQALLDHLNTTTGLYSGRVYGGGLAKFEPGDVARLTIPPQVMEAAA